MEKYGVELDDQKVKTSKEGKETCSRCGKSLDENRLCPKHGSEPLERRADDTVQEETTKD